jgi:hypothetical protein
LPSRRLEKAALLEAKLFPLDMRMAKTNRYKRNGGYKIAGRSEDGVTILEPRTEVVEKPPLPRFNMRLEPRPF